MRWWMWSVVVAGLGARAAVAQTPAGQEPREPGFCAFVRGVGSGEAAVSFAPGVFVSVGKVNAGDVSGSEGVALGRPVSRLTAGLDYDLVGLYRGVAIHRRVGAECERYRAYSVLRSTVHRGKDVGLEAALKARAKVLEGALPEAETLVAARREDLASGRVTVEEVHALQVKLEGLHALARETAKALERLSTESPLTERPLNAWLEEYRAADDRLEVETARLRHASAWSVRLRGGYDAVQDVKQDGALFGTLVVSYNLGGVVQLPADARARAGRQRALEEDVEGVVESVAELLRDLRASRESEQARLDEMTVLVTDLEGQLQDMQALETAKVRRYHDYVVLELARLRAEQAWLKEHVARVGEFLGGERP